MKTGIFPMALAACLWAATCMAQQGTGKTDAGKAVYHVTVELDDGSRLLGVLPADTAFPVQSGNWKAAIAIKWIDTIAFSDDHKTAAITMQNGDRIEAALTIKTLTLAMEIGKVPVDLRFVKTVKVFADADAAAQGLVFWNKLASETDVGHSTVGPELKAFASSNGNPLDVAAGREFVSGDHGWAITIKGSYLSQYRVHNLVLGDLGKLINPEQGCIEFWYCQMEHPVPASNGVYRMFDGDYGFGSCAQFFTLQESLVFALSCGGERQMVSIPEATVPDKEWIHLAAVWNRKGIKGTQDTIRLYLNGKQVAASTASNWGTVAGGEADICGGQDDQCAGKFLMNNLKIWNRAKTDFDEARNAAPSADLAISMVLDPKTFAKSADGKMVTLSLSVKNTTGEIVKYRDAPEATPLVYVVDESGEAVRIYPQPGSGPLSLEHAGSTALQPDAAKFLQFDVPLEAFKKPGQKYKVSIMEVRKGNSEVQHEIFSGAFTLPFPD